MQLEISQASWYLIGGSMLFIILFALFLIFYSSVIGKQNDLLLKQQQLKFDFEQALLESQLEIQEQTLKIISEEIHDNIGQALSLTKLNLGTMDINKPEQLQQKIDDSKHLVSKVIVDLRDLSRSLNTDYVIQIGLQRSIEYELDLLKKAGKHEAKIEVAGAAYRLDPQKELILFRIIQEVLNNVIKHANATIVTVSIKYHPQLFQLSVSDNGEGFDVRSVESANNSNLGLGIRNMYNRAKLIGAEYLITSNKETGTTVQIILPLIQNPNSHDTQ